MDYNRLRLHRDAIMEGYHRSVLLREAVKALRVKKDSWYLDCTLGDGGHSLEILQLGGKVIGVDVDLQAIERARERFVRSGYSGGAGKQGRFKIVRGNFRELKNLLTRMDMRDLRFAGVLFDLGVSSLQLENPERGFSFSKEGPLDMRMDLSLEVKALDLVNVLSRKELYELFHRLGEEKYSKRLADTLVLAREVRSITTTRQLAEIIEKAVGYRKSRIHPATKVFQALRIAVNDELNALQEGLNQTINLIEKDGRIVVISFHSLEDRIVKNTFRGWQADRLGKVLTKKPITPSDQEIRDNVRSRSAKMRVFLI